MRAVIWRAVSTEEQAGDDKVSLSHQEALGREHAAKHGLDVVEVITSDDSRSVIRLDKAMANPRLGYGRLMDMIDAKAFDVLLFYDASRLGRNRGLLSTLQEECYAARIVLYDISNPPQALQRDVTDSGRLIDSLQAAIAQNEVERQNRRLQFGRDGRAQRGDFVYTVPYGYTRTDSGRIDIDDATGPIVRRIFDMYLNGVGLPTIAATLNSEGIATPKGNRWQVGTVAYILNNVARYSGWLEHNRKSARRQYIRVPGNWPALIDERTAAAIRAERVQRASNRHLADTPHLLSGVVWCADCKHPMRYNTSTIRGHPRQYLRCDTGGHAGTTPDNVLLYIRYEMEQLSGVDVDLLLANDDSAERTAADIERARRQLARLLKSLQDADDDRYVTGRLDATRHARAVDRIRAEMAVQEAEIARLQAMLDSAEQVEQRRARLLDILAHGLDMLRSTDPTRANAWLRAHMRVWVQAGDVLAVEWL